jgi:hypothetical protein
MKNGLVIWTLCWIIAHSVLRLITWNSGSPAWAAYLQNLALLAALAGPVLSRQLTLRGVLQSYQKSYDDKVRFSIVTGLICLILIPLGLWLAYVRYYGPLMHAVYSVE